jgi:hypothetical protein
LAGLLPLPPPEGFPVLLGPFGGVLFAVSNMLFPQLSCLCMFPYGTFAIIRKVKRQMGTNEVQKQIKEMIAGLGWTQKKLARVIYTELNDFDDEAEIIKFEERLKKDLTRSTVKIEKLECYLSIISRHPEFEKMDVVITNYKPTSFISSFLVKEMKATSKLLDETLE